MKFLTSYFFNELKFVLHFPHINILHLRKYKNIRRSRRRKKLFLIFRSINKRYKDNPHRLTREREGFRRRSRKKKKKIRIHLRVDHKLVRINEWDSVGRSLQLIIPTHPVIGYPPSLVRRLSLHTGISIPTHPWYSASLANSPHSPRPLQSA